MAEPRHRIATLLAASLVDGDRLLVSKEPRIQEALKSRREIFQRFVEEHSGHAFRTAGTSLVAEFPNAVDAVRAAVTIHRAVLSENDPLPPDERVQLRVGLSVGDVTEDGEGLAGDGVDVAVALAALAVPGGICLAGSVYDHARHRMHVGVEFAGQKRLRNSPERIRIYQVVEPGVEKGYFSFWGELKRRNVVRAGLTYAVVAWLLVQVADVVLPTFDAPAWALRGLITVTVLGFPVALFVAWVYELTPMGLMRSDEVLRQDSIRWLTGRRLNVAIMGVLVVAVAFLVFDGYLRGDLPGRGERPVNSIAVLAFENFGQSEEDEYFADGLADELLTLLGTIQELKVASRTASFYFKGKDVDTETIASTLMVGNVLSGSVRRVGDRIRVTAALDDAETGDLLWSEQYERRLEDILDIQSQIAQAVASAIVPVLSPESLVRIETRPTDSVDAYDYFLRGRDYLRRPAEVTTLASAIELFNRAIDLDTQFAHAYAGLCEAHIGSYEFAREPESFASAERACRRAIQLDTGLWEVRVALGNLYRINGQYDDSKAELETAISLQPNAVSPYLTLAQTYAGQGLLEDAEATFRQAEEIESGYWGVHRAFGNFLYDLSRYSEAVERHQKVIELTPDSGIGYDNLGNTYLAMGALDDAERVFNQSPLPSRWTYMYRGVVYNYKGDYRKAIEDELRAIELAPEIHSTWGFLGDAYRHLGETADAQNAYQRAIELAERDLEVSSVDWRSMGPLGLYYAYTGQVDQVVPLLERMFELTSYSDAYYYAARAHLYLGNVEEAYDSLQRVIEEGWPRRLLESDPDFAELRDQSRFQSLVAAASY